MMTLSQNYYTHQQDQCPFPGARGTCPVKLEIALEKKLQYRKVHTHPTLILEQLQSGLNVAQTEAWTSILQCGTHLGELTVFHSLGEQ